MSFLLGCVNAIDMPALAGWVMGAAGVGASFWLNAASFLAVIGSLLVVRAQQARKDPAAGGGGAMGAAFRFIGRERRVQDILILSACITFFGFAAGQLIWAIVSNTLHAGPEALGLIMGVVMQMTPVWAAAMFLCSLSVPVVLTTRAECRLAHRRRRRPAAAASRSPPVDAGDA